MPKNKPYSAPQFAPDLQRGGGYDAPQIQPDLEKYDTGYFAPTADDVEEYLEVESETTPFVPILRGVRNAIFTNWEDDVKEEYSNNGKKFQQDKSELISYLKENDFARGFLDEINFAAFADNPDYVTMTHSGAEWAGNMAGLVTRDAAISMALSWVPGVNFSTVMTMNHGITQYRRERGGGADMEHAIQAGVAGSISMGMGLGISHGLGIAVKGLGGAAQARFTGVALDSFWAKGAAAYVGGGLEMTSWIASEQYANRVIRNGIDMTFNPQEFSYKEDLNDSLTQVREGEEPISAESMAMLFVTGGLLRTGFDAIAAPVKWMGGKMKRITDARGQQAETIRIQEELVRKGFNVNSEATLALDEESLATFVMEITPDLLKNKSADIIAEKFNSLPPAYQGWGTLEQITSAFREILMEGVK